MLAFVFPGQGSQYPGMGAELFDDVIEFRALERTIDKIAGFSVRATCLNASVGELRDTRLTQPCMYVVNALHYFTAIAEGSSPQCFAGHSLGEYNALMAAGAIDFFSGLRLVKIRGELMSQIRAGGMAAISGIPSEEVPSLIEKAGPMSLDIALYNAPSQTVISGPHLELVKLEPIVRAHGGTFAELSVSGPFHSRLMRSARQQFEKTLEGVTFSSCHLPVFSNVTSTPYPTNDAVEMRRLLAAQLTDSVRWTETIDRMLDAGTTEFKEIGPKAVLTALIGQIKHCRGITGA